MHVIVNGETRELPAPISVAQLLAALQLEARHVAVEVNRQLVPRGEHAARQLADGDRLEVVTLVGGG